MCAQTDTKRDDRIKRQNHRQVDQQMDPATVGQTDGHEIWALK